MHIRLTIEHPCTEKFGDMPRTGCGMYCNKCEKEVIDFTAMSDVELMDMLRLKPGTCGLFLQEQLNKNYLLPAPPVVKGPLRLWTAMLTFISLLFFKESNGQANSRTVVKTEHSHNRDTVKPQGKYGNGTSAEQNKQTDNSATNTSPAVTAGKPMVTGGAPIARPVDITDSAAKKSKSGKKKHGGK